jgi:hypothetical protein
VSSLQVFLQNFVSNYRIPVRATCPASLTLLDFMAPMVKSGPTNCEASHYAIFSSLRYFVSLGPNMLFSFCSQSMFLPRVRDQVPRPYKATGKITDLYILIFTFLGRKWDDTVSEVNDSKHSPNLISSLSRILMCYCSSEISELYCIFSKDVLSISI